MDLWGEGDTFHKTQIKDKNMQGQHNQTDDKKLIDQSGAPLNAGDNVQAQRQSTDSLKLKDVFSYIASYKGWAGIVAGGTALTALITATTIHFFNNDTELAKVVNDTPETILTQLDGNTTLITQGDNVALRYKGVVCPLAMGFPENVTLTLGNSGDASLSPSEPTAEQTILGSLGINRSVSIVREIAPNAQSLMADFYAYAEDCNNRITALQANDNNEEAGIPVPLQSFIVAPPAPEQ